MKSIAIGSCKMRSITQSLHKNKQNARSYLLKYWGWVFSIDQSASATLLCYFSFDSTLGFNDGKIPCQDNAVMNYPNGF